MAKRRRRSSTWSLLAVLAVGFPLSASLAADNPDYQALRRDMVDVIELQIQLSGEETGVTELDPRLLEALRQIPRHRFVPEPLQRYAYGMQPLPVSEEQNIATPFLIALMTQLVAPDRDHKVFETGTGAGYHAAILSKVAKSVYSVEVVSALAASSADTFKQLGFDNVQSKQGDGYFGWQEKAPFDAIIIKEAVDHVPPPLLRQLKVGGRLVMPLGPDRGPQILTVIEKESEGRLKKTRVMEVIFSPLQGGKRT